MRAWVAGASGLVGRSLVDGLLARTEVERVTAIVRRSTWPAGEKLDERVVDFEDLASSLAGSTATHVFCCLGTTMRAAKTQAAFRRVDHDYALALAQLAKAAGAASFLLVSSMGANPGSPIFYNRVKGETERDVAGVGLPTVHIVRPSLLLGERAERRTGERIASAVARPLSGLLVGPLRKFAPIEASAVARALVLLSLEPRSGVFTHESDELASLARASARS